LLSRLGHNVEEAEDGLAAFEILNQKGGDYFDLVISDQNMPKMTGLELVQASQAQWPDLPFVIITGFSPDQLEAAAQKLSCIRAVLKKPVNRDALTAHIDEIMSGKALSSPLPPPHQE
jgi:CheY-like chemotaxis protein